MGTDENSFRETAWAQNRSRALPGYIVLYGILQWEQRRIDRSAAEHQFARNYKKSTEIRTVYGFPRIQIQSTPDRNPPARRSGRIPLVEVYPRLLYAERFRGKHFVLGIIINQINRQNEIYTKDNYSPHCITDTVRKQRITAKHSAFLMIVEVNVRNADYD